MMIDFHTHTILSDGVLIPAEHIRRAEVRGYKVLGMADHGDLAMIERIVPALVAAAKCENELGRMAVLAGIELTHVRPEHMAQATELTRKLGANMVLCHGETIAEPVMPGTNRAAIEAGVDYLAHPGLISVEDAELAAEKGVYLEVSSKPGHSLTNGHVVQVARQVGARLIFGSDSHGPDQMPTREYAERVCRGAGLTVDEVDQMFENAREFALTHGISRIPE